MDSTVNESLIFPGADDAEPQSVGISMWRFLLALCLVLVVYKGGEEMAKTTTKQFVFSWCEKYLSETGGKPASDNVTVCSDAVHARLTDDVRFGAKQGQDFILGHNKEWSIESQNKSNQMPKGHTFGNNGSSSVVYDQIGNITMASNNCSENASKSATVILKCGKKEETAAEKLASKWELYLDLLNVILLYFSVAVYGTLSDYLGRKMFFVLALFGWLLRCGFVSAIIFFDLHIAWMLVAYGVDGLCGSHYVISMLSFVSTADKTHEAHERVLGMAVMEAVLGVGKFTTQFGNGYFIDKYGFFYPMCTATAASLLTLILTIVFVKESAPSVCKSSVRTSDSLGTSGMFSVSNVPSFKTLFRRYIGFYIDKENKQERTIFWICLVAFLLTEFGQDAKSDPLTLFQLGSPFCWSSEIIGWYNTSSVLVTYLAGCVIIKMLQHCLSDPVICCLGTVSAMAFCAVTGIARSTLWLFLGKNTK